eukprot:1205771-Pleurochrysis_carterae.AAC.1
MRARASNWISINLPNRDELALRSRVGREDVLGDGAVAVAGADGREVVHDDLDALGLARTGLARDEDALVAPAAVAGRHLPLAAETRVRLLRHRVDVRRRVGHELAAVRAYHVYGVQPLARAPVERVERDADAARVPEREQILKGSNRFERGGIPWGRKAKRAMVMLILPRKDSKSWRLERGRVESGTGGGRATASRKLPR